jgi:hypothetical protein
MLHKLTQSQELASASGGPQKEALVAMHFVRLEVALGRSARRHRSGMDLTQHLLTDRRNSQIRRMRGYQWLAFVVSFPA